MITTSGHSTRLLGTRRAGDGDGESAPMALGHEATFVENPSTGLRDADLST